MTFYFVILVRLPYITYYGIEVYFDMKSNCICIILHKVMLKYVAVALIAWKMEA